MRPSSLLLHPKTRSALDIYLSSPTQVLALLGPEGAGKKFLALSLISQLLDKEDLSQESRLITLEPEEGKSEIAIETVRNLIKALRVKQPGDSIRVVFIDEADRLGLEAQNALLKTLEQPNPDTLFILSVRDASRLLPTVLSRTQKMIVHPVENEAAQSFYSKSHSSDEIQRAWLLSEGQAGQLNQLLVGDEQQPLKAAVETAKKFLSSSRYERLLGVDAMSKERDQALNLLTGLSRILKTLHHSNIQNGRQTNSLKILNARQLVQDSARALNTNASAKAVLLKLILNLPV